MISIEVTVLLRIVIQNTINFDMHGNHKTFYYPIISIELIQGQYMWSSSNKPKEIYLEKGEEASSEIMTEIAHL